MKLCWILFGMLLIMAGCSSNANVELPKNPKPGPTVIPTVRDAGAGSKVK
ncbi:MAG TPA: hypothetical protein PLN21_13630 [Gemmatales bacterium]|nr:hypothetical protein [Gemmatales bacterium]